MSDQWDQKLFKEVVVEALAMGYRFFLCIIVKTETMMNKRGLSLQNVLIRFFPEFHYLVELNLGYPTEAERWVQGYLKINLYGSKDEQTGIDLTSE